MTQPQDPPQCDPSEEFRLCWDTSYVAEKQRFSYFREGICQAFFACTPEVLPDRSLDARITTANLSGGLISKIAVTPHHVIRTGSDIASISGEFLSLGLHLVGGMSGEMYGKPFSHESGQVTLMSPNEIRNFDVDPRQRYATMSLLFEKSRFAGLPDLDDNYLVKSAFLAPIKLCLTLINDGYGSASKLQLTHLFDAALSLLQADLIQDRDFLEDRCFGDSAVRGGILRLIQEFVCKHIADPGLSTISIASHFGISTRYVQKLFADDGSTLKSFITTTRLAKVQADLRDPSLSHIPGGDIAFRWGFRDMTTFHRNFKLRFGDTPNQMRNRSENGASDLS